jgi:hypothetical protein
VKKSEGVWQQSHLCFLGEKDQVKASEIMPPSNTAMTEEMRGKHKRTSFFKKKTKT